MLDANEAAQKIAAATIDVQQAKMAQPSRGNHGKLKTAERRLATLLALFIGFKDDPRFKSAYQREMSGLSG
jgi:hypothetical protein